MVKYKCSNIFTTQGIKCKLYRNMTVLVHGAAGALGQAAISIALANQCQVFATVSDMRKKRLLRKMFPDLPGKSSFSHDNACRSGRWRNNRKTTCVTYDEFLRRFHKFLWRLVSGYFFITINFADEHIGNSRDLTFGDMVLGATKGEGCNVIISCVRGHLKNVSDSKKIKSSR